MNRPESRSAASDRSSLITSDGHEPTRNSRLDFGAALEELRDHAIEFLVGVGKSREVAVFDDCGRETRFGEDHDAGGRLHQMRAGPRTDDQEEGILDLAVQPDDAGQPAEDFALAALAQDLGLLAAVRLMLRLEFRQHVHWAYSSERPDPALGSGR